MFDKVDLWIKRSNFLIKDAEKNKKQKNNKPLRRIMLMVWALQQVSSVWGWWWEGEFWRDILPYRNCLKENFQSTVIYQKKIKKSNDNDPSVVCVIHVLIKKKLFSSVCEKQSKISFYTYISSYMYLSQYKIPV